MADCVRITEDLFTLCVLTNIAELFQLIFQVSIQLLKLKEGLAAWTSVFLLPPLFNANSARNDVAFDALLGIPSHVLTNYTHKFLPHGVIWRCLLDCNLNILCLNVRSVFKLFFYPFWVCLKFWSYWYRARKCSTCTLGIARFYPRCFHLVFGTSRTYRITDGRSS